MLNIQRFVCNMFQENCYVASDKTKECVIIDCGAFYEEEKRAIIDYINNNKLIPKHLISTHAHIDHNFGNNAIYTAFGLKPEVCIDDKILMGKLKEQAYAFIGLNYDENIPDVKNYFTDKDTISFGTHKFNILKTPGHTPGSVLFYCANESIAFSGATLFKLSIGRTDFEFGSYEDIIRSLKNIAIQLPAQTAILPGHGEKTTLKEEITYNPYFK